MTRTEIYDKAAEIVRAYASDKSTTITEKTRLADDLGVNSARMVDIIIDVEQEFGIRISDSDMAKISSFGGAVDLISSSLNVVG